VFFFKKMPWYSFFLVFCMLDIDGHLANENRWDRD
jgi:hypothetical protein